MDFVAFDFETANSDYDSACSLGIAVVKDNKIVESKHWYIKPEPLEFNKINVSIHKITEATVINMPTFQEYWDNTFKQYFENNILVAHNLKFDVCVLGDLCEKHNIIFNTLEGFCTYKLSKVHIPELSNHKLCNVSNYYGLELNHHNAVSDAVACAEIMIRISKETNCNSIKELRNYQDRKEQFAEIEKNKIKYDRLHKLMTSNNKFFIDKKIAITGEFDFFTRKELQQIILSIGGINSSTVSSKTDFLLEGEQTSFWAKDIEISSKSINAINIKNNGGKIEILHEKDFLNIFFDEDEIC